MKVLLGLPCYNGWSRIEQARFFYEVGRSKHDVIIEPCVSTPIDVARNWLSVLAARIRNCDVLMMVDADAVPPTGLFDVFCEFLERQETPSVIASPMTMFGGGVVPMGCHELKNVRQIRTDEIVGTHCIAIHTKIFNMIETPWFEFSYTDGHSGLVGGEDGNFCKKCHAANINVFVDGRFWCGHSKSVLLERPRIIKC